MRTPFLANVFMAASLIGAAACIDDGQSTDSTDPVDDEVSAEPEQTSQVVDDVELASYTEEEAITPQLAQQVGQPGSESTALDPSANEADLSVASFDEDTGGEADLPGYRGGHGHGHGHGHHHHHH